LSKSMTANSNREYARKQDITQYHSDKVFPVSLRRPALAIITLSLTL